MVEVVATPWAPKDVDELLREIADDNYGVSDDRSTALATPAIKAHNAELRKANAQIDVEMVACSDAQTLAAIEAYNAKVAACAIKTYNAKASMYEQVVQKRGQPLREGFTIVKVRAARARFRELCRCYGTTRRSDLPPACMCSLSELCRCYGTTRRSDLPPACMCSLSAGKSNT